MSPDNKKLIEHFENPRHLGEIENPDGVGVVGNLVCGDLMTFYIRVLDDRLQEVKFQAFGCGAATAVSSYIADTVQGRTLAEAKALKIESLFEDLRGLPENRIHCAFQGLDALNMAIEDYEERRRGKRERGKRMEIREGLESHPDHVHPVGCCCPYCNAALLGDEHYCEPCGKEFQYCKHCGQALPLEAETCLACGTKLRAAIR
jgi:nitrogen fixation NifU-like protein